jgi:hypothetical protein
MFLSVYDRRRFGSSRCQATMTQSDKSHVFGQSCNSSHTRRLCGFPHYSQGRPLPPPANGESSCGRGKQMSIGVNADVGFARDRLLCKSRRGLVFNPCLTEKIKVCGPVPLPPPSPPDQQKSANKSLMNEGCPVQSPLAKGLADGGKAGSQASKQVELKLARELFWWSVVGAHWQEGLLTGWPQNLVDFSQNCAAGGQDSEEGDPCPRQRGNIVDGHHSIRTHPGSHMPQCSSDPSAA